MRKPFLFGFILFLGLILFANENSISAQSKKTKNLVPTKDKKEALAKQTAFETKENVGFLSAF